MLASSRLLSFVILFFACLIVQQTSALVDNSRPNLSGFQLRHVDVGKEALRRLDQVISKLSDGAIIMKESLFVDANNIKCPAYAQLFKLIKEQKSNDNIKMRQNVIQSLAIVVTYDRVFYHKIYLQSIPKLTEYFLEAAQTLEGNEDAKAKDAWLDLIGCLFEYMLDDTAVNNYLYEPNRVKALASIKKFMSIPVDSEKTPSGLVSNLIKKYDNNKPIVVDASMYEEARKIIIPLEDNDTQLQRIEYEQNNKQPSQQTTIDNDNLAKHDDEKQITEEEMKNLNLPNEIEITVPTNGPNQGAGGSSNNNNNNNNNNGNTFTGGPITIDQLATLKFIKMRLESDQRTPRLSMRLAFDFSTHWEVLLKSRLDLSTDVGKAANQFRNDKKNIALYERVTKVIDQYKKIVEVLEEIKTMNSIRLNSVEDFGQKLIRLNTLLSEIDSSFDINDLRRLQEVWLVKYRKYSVMQKFISADHWGRK